MDRSASGAVPGLPCCSNISLRCAVSVRVLFLAFRYIPILARAASSPPERQSPKPLLPLSVRFPYMPALPLFRQCANPRTAVEMAERSTGATVEMAERSLFLFPSPPFLPLPLSPLSLSNIIRSTFSDSGPNTEPLSRWPSGPRRQLQVPFLAFRAIPIFTVSASAPITEPLRVQLLFLACRAVAILARAASSPAECQSPNHCRDGRPSSSLLPLLCSLQLDRRR